MAEPWHTVRLTRDVRIFARPAGTTRLYDEKSNYKTGTVLSIGAPEHLFFNNEQRAACRVIEKNGTVVLLVSYVLISDFEDKAILQAAVQKIRKKKEVK
jgi:hypothetical protein